MRKLASALAMALGGCVSLWKRNHRRASLYDLQGRIPWKTKKSWDGKAWNWWLLFRDPSVVAGGYWRLCRYSWQRCEGFLVADGIGYLVRLDLVMPKLRWTQTRPLLADQITHTQKLLPVNFCVRVLRPEKCALRYCFAHFNSLCPFYFSILIYNLIPYLLLNSLALGSLALPQSPTSSTLDEKGSRGHP